MESAGGTGPELSCLYGSGHTDKTLAFDKYLMHPGSDDGNGNVGGVLREEDATNFFGGNKI
jgi:hypothetical protein